MKEEAFAELIESAHQALDHARGRRELRTTVLPGPPEPMSARDVKRLRDQLHASQAVFAHYLNVSTKLVQAWEADRRSPEGAVLRLLRIGEQFPGLVFGDVALVRPKRPGRSAPRERSRGARRLVIE